MLDYNDPKIKKMLQEERKKLEKLSMEELDALSALKPGEMRQRIADMESGKTLKFIMEGNVHEFIQDVKDGKYDNA